MTHPLFEHASANTHSPGYVDAADAPESHPRPPLTHDEAGLTTVEYVIILFLIAIAAIGAWQVFGGTVEYKAREAATDVGAL